MVYHDERQLFYFGTPYANITIPGSMPEHDRVVDTRRAQEIRMTPAQVDDVAFMTRIHSDGFRAENLESGNKDIHIYVYKNEFHS